MSDASDEPKAQGNAQQTSSPMREIYEAYAQLLKNPDLEAARRFAQQYPESQLSQNIEQKIAAKIKQLQHEEQRQRWQEEQQRKETEGAQIWQQVQELGDIDAVAAFIHDFAGTKAAYEAVDQFWDALGQRWITRQPGQSNTRREVWETITAAKRQGENTLSLYALDLTDLPAEIGYLPQLKRLVVTANQLTALPPEIGQLTQLEELDVGGNQLSSLPPEIGQLTQLKGLYVSSNQLTALPPEIGQLTQLEELNVDGNMLTALPPEIGQLAQLKELDVEGNQLTSLPPEIGLLADGLRGIDTDHDDPAQPRLDLSGNPLKPPLDELWEEGQNDAVLAYLKAQYDEGMRG